MDTRLGRLFTLLDTGSSAAARKAAAQQIGEIAKLHPYDLQNLLERAHRFLKFTKWETRIAAGLAIEAISNAVAVWNPKPDSTAVKSDSSAVPTDSGRLALESFDITAVLKNGIPLLGSSGEEYASFENALDSSALANQRQIIKSQLGLGGSYGADLVDDDDLMAVDTPAQPQKVDEEKLQKGAEIENMLHQPTSARMRARMKKEAKRAMQKEGDGAKLRSSQSSLNNSDANIKTRSVVTDQPQNKDKIVIESVFDADRAFEDANEWPFERFCDELLIEMVNASWVIRHGAAVGLREILKRHASSAGRRADTNEEGQATLGRAWIIDCCIRCICVMVLDRFSDMSGDDTVAPVRETVAQVLATLYNHINLQDLDKVTSLLFMLTTQTSWEVRHSAFLGLKYFVAVRQDLLEPLLPPVVRHAIAGLNDSADDVRAAAADTLLPILRANFKLPPASLLDIKNTIWNVLQELDDITASTASVMNLLAQIYASDLLQSEPADSASNALTVMLPRLYPFFRHNIRSVRTAVMQTLLKVLSAYADSASTWLPPVLMTTLQMVFQNIVLESDPDIIQQSHRAWSQLLLLSPNLSGISDAQLNIWYQLMTTENSFPFNKQLMFHPHTTSSDRRGGVIDNAKATVQIRIETAIALARLANAFPYDYPIRQYNLSLLYGMVLSQSATQRQGAALVIVEWAKLMDADALASFPEELTNCLLQLLETRNELGFYFSETITTTDAIRTECFQLLVTFQNMGVQISAELVNNISIMTMEQANNLVTAQALQVIGALPEEARQLNTLTTKELLENRRSRVLNLLAFLETFQTELQIGVTDSAAAAIVYLKKLPQKLSPIINSIMTALKREQNALIQRRAAESMSVLMQLIKDRQPSPNPTVIKQLAGMLIQDLSDLLQTQERLELNSSSTIEIRASAADAVKKRKAPEPDLSLSSQLQRSGAHPASSPTQPSQAKKRKIEVDEDAMSAAAAIQSQLSESLLARRGAQFALEECARLFGDQLLTDLPALNTLIAEGLFAPLSVPLDKQTASLMAVRTLATSVKPSVRPFLLQCMDHIIPRVSANDSTLRAISSATLCVVVKHTMPKSMSIILKNLLPVLQDASNVSARRGAAMALHAIVEELSLDVLPYIMFLIAPILKRMSDQDEQVRRLVAFSFATLVKLMPLEESIPNPPDMPDELVKQREAERSFLSQLLGGGKLDEYALPIRINTELRQYQKDGVNWLAFLNKYNLHGILADDMGLGKTLQTICMIASDFHYRRERFAVNPIPENRALPALVVCPPTLVAHWHHEIKRFCDSSIKSLQYMGLPAERRRMFEAHKRFESFQVVITSYDVLRNDIDLLETISFNYCILDEGHIIKNPKTKITQSVKRVVANNRLLLSGTPIQNNVLELWSLFDFLMPGFLGTEKQFAALYAKPIQSSRDAKASSRDQEMGVLAMEALHRQVLPFILRRMKEDVLHDLPPKIIQDVQIELSPLQIRLYERFSKTQQTDVDGDDENASKQQGQHIFQALQYLRKLCSSPKLVLSERHPDYTAVRMELASRKESIDDVEHSPKLIALRDLLHECGIGVEEDAKSAKEPDPFSSSAVNQHRVLVFCQLKQMLDVVEQDLFKKHMPSVTYMRLDGDVPQVKRVPMVEKFNSDPSIDVLLLSTKVGGLGLNLTGADVVVFLEHDWNPQADLQAMDRAHRIGAKKTVNVYRIITKGTLEEKIMSLQQFKLKIANTVVSKENQSFSSMGSEQLLDLFNYSGDTAKGKGPTQASGSNGEPADGAAGAGSTGLKAALASLDEMWDSTQYAEEFNLDSFVDKLR